MPEDQNHLIASLPQRDRKRFLALCEPVGLVFAEVLAEAGSPTKHVYFPVEGFISLLTREDGKSALEVGMIGREGMLGVQLALDVAAAPLHALVQGPGLALRMGLRSFRRELAQSAALRRILHRYVYVLMQQLATSAGCLRFHEIGPRLARWLLMSHDRAHADRFRVTHEFLAFMLGVRRVGVTRAAGVLQQDRLIEYKRGAVTVLDRAGLEAVACSCYATDRKTYVDLLD